METASSLATGSITMMYGTLSTNPEIITETRRISTKPKRTLPFVIDFKNPAKSERRPVSLIAPTTTKIPIRKKIVSQSSYFMSVKVSFFVFF